MSNITTKIINDSHISSPTACKSLTTGEIYERSSLAIHARVADKQLRINIPSKVAQHRNMEDLIAATLFPLGGKRHRIISSPKLSRPNSHGIVVTLEEDSLVWTWPHLSREDIGSSSTGEWRPVQGANPRGVPSKHIECAQFCDIANRGGVIFATTDSQMQLQFTLPKLTPIAQSLTCAQKSPLSPTAPVFNYGGGFFNVSESWKDILSPLAKSFTPVQHTNTAAPTNVNRKPCKDILSPLAKSFTPVQHTDTVATIGSKPCESVLSPLVEPVLAAQHIITVAPIKHVHFPPHVKTSHWYSHTSQYSSQGCIIIILFFVRY